jgi:hypothetical protein
MPVQAMVGQPGAHVPHGDNITMKNPERGTSLSYTLDRLKRERSRNDKAPRVRYAPEKL